MFMLYVVLVVIVGSGGSGGDDVIVVVAYLFDTMFLFLRDSFIYYFYFDATLVFGTQRSLNKNLNPNKERKQTEYAEEKETKKKKQNKM